MLLLLVYDCMVEYESEDYPISAPIQGISPSVVFISEETNTLSFQIHDHTMHVEIDYHFVHDQASYTLMIVNYI